MKIRNLALAAALSLTTVALAGPAFAGATRVQNAIWNDGHLYGTVPTPTSFVAPPEHSTDIIYSFSMSGLTGQRSIAEAAPGDTDFNGGRWSVVMVVFTPAGVAALDNGSGAISEELTSDAALLELVDLGYAELFPTGFYFECPMLP